MRVASTRVIPGFLSGLSMLLGPFTGSATLKTVAFWWKPWVLCMTGSELTMTIVPTGSAWTLGTNRQFLFTISGFWAGFCHAFPFSTYFR